MKFIVSINKDNISLYRGLKRQEVRKTLNSPVSEFKKNEFSKNTTDSFEKINIHCFYDEKDELSEIEIFRPNEFYIDSNKNFNWLNQNNSEILEFLSKCDFCENIEVEGGIIINSYAIATVMDHRFLTECCYVDLEKVSYLNLYED